MVSSSYIQEALIDDIMVLGRRGPLGGLAAPDHLWEEFRNMHEPMQVDQSSSGYLDGCLADGERLPVLYRPPIVFFTDQIVVGGSACS